MEWEHESKIIDSIRIICKRSQNEDFVFFEEFFKLCGIFVIRCAEPQIPHLSEDDEEYTDYELDITHNFGWMVQKENEKMMLKKAIEMVYGGNRSFRDELSYLAPVYVNHDLKLHNMRERYFYAPVFSRVYESLANFRAAVRELEETKINGRHVKYFRISCQHKINVLLGKLHKEKEYSGYMLIADALNLCGRERGYTQGYLLAGIVADGDLQFLNDSIHFYDNAFTGKKEIDAYIHYRKGRYYEKIDHDEERALTEYRKAYRMDQSNYRALFKVAIIELSIGEMYMDYRYIRRSISTFREIPELLYDDIENCNLLPIQLEYLAKTYKNLYDIYDIWMERKSSAMQALYELCDLERMIDEDAFFDHFFGDGEKADEERRLLKCHLNLVYYKDERDTIDNDYYINKRGKIDYVK
ncbi:hypothetical protein GN277_05205 [Lachnospiraceae bacterium WCA-9-b2]|uniref:Uncharacterized protein n=1 Tax=Sporofaciens musculi TaxID=2681861 RepID=A0A7X3MEA5_9FIRM|nr:hypothetical protein [Sporofaciens musculi]MXP74798.1 hypothetical protein [Sporofaciens musculi]